MAATLNGLPTELLQEVAEDVERDDLLALRLCSREISSKVDDVFVERFFTKRRHLVTVYSLGKLVEMTEVSRLSRKMKTLEIVVTSIDKWTTWRDDANAAPMSDRYEAQYRVMGDSPLPRKKRNRPETKSQKWETSLEALRKWTEKQVVHARWYAERDELSGGFDVLMLSKVFQNLKSSKVTLAAVEVINDYDGAFGVRALETHLGLGRGKNKGCYGTYFARFRRHRTPTLVLESLAAVEYSLPELLLGNEVTLCMFQNLLFNNATMNRLESIFSKLKILEVGFNYFQSGDLKEEAGLDSLTQLVKAAHSLEEMRLSFDEEAHYDDEVGMPSMVLKSLAQTKLKKLSIAGGCYYQKDFCELLRYHSATLIELEINDVDMPKREDWRLVFKCIATDMRLEYVGISGLSRNAKFMSRGSGGVQGADKVRSWMAEIAESAKFKSPDEELYGTDSDSDG